MSVDAVVDRVRNNLNEHFLDWDVTESELKDNNQALKELSPAERNEAISKLSDDELRHWADETTGLNSPLNADDRRDLLNGFAADLDTTQLARVSRAFGVQDVAASVASHAPADKKVDFIKGLQADADGSAVHDFSVFGVSQTTYGNDNAHAIGQVLASLKDSPGQFRSAVQSLDQAGKLDDVMAAAAGQQITTVVQNSPGAVSSTTVSFSDKTLQDILAGAAALPATDLPTRTTVFKAVAPQLEAMQQSTGLLTDISGRNAETAQRTADAMGKLLTREQAESAGIVDKQTVPPGVSMDQNISEAQKHFSINPGDWFWFYGQVKNGAPWDYKQQGAQYQDFGNFNFGMTAAAMGIPEDIGLRGAGYAQGQAGTSNSSWGNPWDWSGPYGDDPADQAQIQAGYQYYNSGLWRIWSD